MVQATSTFAAQFAGGFYLDKRIRWANFQKPEHFLEITLANCGRVHFISHACSSGPL
jgi:hypothetical protein